MKSQQALKWQHTAWSAINKHYAWSAGADLEGGAPGARPSIFCRDKAPDFVWGSKAKRMHQIEQINFENYLFSVLLRGHIPLRHPLSPQALKFCQSLIWAPPLFKNPGSAPDRRVDRPTFLTIGCVIMALGTLMVLSFSFVSLSQHSWRKSVCENWE